MAAVPQMILVANLSKIEHKSPAEYKWEYFICDDINIRESPKIITRGDLGSPQSRKDAFAAGETKFYHCRDGNGTALVIVTGTFPKLGGVFTRPSTCTDLVDLFSWYYKERKKGTVGYGRPAAVDNMVSLNREICTVLALFTGYNMTRLDKNKKTHEEFLNELVFCSPIQDDICGDLSCISSLSGVTQLDRGALAAEPSLRELEQTYFPIFNPLDRCRPGDNYKLGAIIFGRRSPTIFHAFLDGVVVARPDIDVFDGLRGLLNYANGELGVVCDCTADDDIRIYDLIYYYGIETDLSSKSLSRAILTSYESRGPSTEDSRKLFAKEFIREAFLEDTSMGDFQLAALCRLFHVNVALYDHSFAEGGAALGISVRCASIDRFCYNDDYPTVKIMRGGNEFVCFCDEKVSNEVTTPPIFYSAIFDGGEPPFDVFPESLVFNPQKVDCGFFHSEINNLSINFHGMQSSASMFAAFSDGLKLRVHALHDRPGYQWLLKESRLYILNVLDRLNDEGDLVYEDVFRNKADTNRLNPICQSYILLNTYPRDNSSLRKLFSWLYLIEDFRDGVGSYQLAALCLCYEVNVQLVFTEKRLLSSCISGQNMVENSIVSSDFKKYFYGPSYPVITLVENTDYTTEPPRQSFSASNDMRSL